MDSNLSFEPMREDYRNKSHGQTLGKLWTVFQERSDGQGYYIFFDENSMQFGLGLKDDDGVMIRIGEYGSFLKTLWSV
jgi:hypothetical protein